MRGNLDGFSSLNWVSLVEVLRDYLGYLWEMWEMVSLELVMEVVGMEIETSLLRVAGIGVVVVVLGPKDSRSRLRTESVKLLPMLFCLRSSMISLSIFCEICRNWSDNSCLFLLILPSSSLV